MRKKIKMRRKRKIDKLSLYIIVIILLIMSIIMGLVFVNKKFSPVLLNYAEIETRKLSTMIINRAITKQLANGIEVDKLFNVIKNNDGDIQSVDFNPAIVNKVLSTTTNIVQLYLRAIEQGNIDLLELSDDISLDVGKEKLKKGIIYEIPIGVVTGSSILSNLGPRIPVRLNIIGDVVSNIRTEIRPYGINNALVEVFVHIQVSEQVNIPFMSKRILVSSDIPVAMKLIQGRVPTYYGSGITTDSNIFTIPIE